MPQIEQLQTYYWGALRADPIELASDGINVATGPNGSGKTTSLDGLKLMLGVSDLGRRPADYIYDGGGGESAERASRAIVKAIFANPQGPGRSGRVFAAAGRGCEASAHVTAICEVTRDGKRRYAMLPGAVVWGEDVAADIEAMRSRVTGNQWMNPLGWTELLNRAGVSKALLGVIAVKQGETDKTIEGSPERLLQRVLELTGKQETLEEFRRAKVQLRDARQSYDEASERLRSERNRLHALNAQARQHADFVEQTERKAWIEQVGMPAAKRMDLIATRKALANEREGQAAALERNREELARLEESIPALSERLKELEGKLTHFDHRDSAARDAETKAAEEHGVAKAVVAGSERAVETARTVAGDIALDEASASASAEAAATARDELRSAEREHDELLPEIVDLEAGRPRRPAELDGFRAALADTGIESDLVAERLEVTHAVAAEAVLGDGVWALVVTADRLDAAVDLARQRGYPLPIVAAGDGGATGALAGASGLDEVGAYLAEIDLPIGQPGVGGDGLVRGQHWAALRAPERPVLGHQARADRLDAARARRDELGVLIPDVRERVRQAQQRALAIAQAVLAVKAIESERATLSQTKQALAAAREAVEAIGKEREPIGRELGRIEEQLAGQESRKALVGREIRTRAPQIDTYDKRLSALDSELAGLPELSDDLNLASVGTVETLSHELSQVEERLADETRFPPEVRGQLVLADQESQQGKVTEVEEMLEGRREDLEAVMVEVERARERYDQHIRQVVAILAKRFREVCEQASMEGDIELRPGETEGEFGIDVKVAHVRGEAKRSYRSSAHSSGQRAKISLLILLAAMGLEGSADLLIMDEHAAHLDSRNIDAVAEVMNALKDRVQFILATPTNAEAGRLAWCDHQIAFYPRPAGEPFAPPVRLFTRRPLDSERYAEMGQLTLAG